MSWFSSVFKSVGNAVKTVAKTAYKGFDKYKTFTYKNGMSMLSAVPLVGDVLTPYAVKLVEKIAPDALPQAQEEAVQQIVEASIEPPVSPDKAIKQASEAKVNLVASGITSDQASAIGSVVHAVSTASPSESLSIVTSTEAALPSAALSRGISKEEIKRMADAALKAAKEAAIQSYLDETESGKQTKKDAIDAQGQKMLPYLLGAGLLLVFLFNKKK